MRRNAFTLIELLVVISIIALLIGILLPSLARGRELANRTVCSKNLNSIYTSMYAYSVTDTASKFPVVGKVGSATNATGFDTTLNGLRGGTTAPTTAQLEGQATASLWMLVRNGSVGVKSFICPSSGDSPDPLEDTSDQSAALETTWDFDHPDHLSFSFTNMYHEVQDRQWSANAPADYILMADDNNNNSGGALHTHEKSEANLTQSTIEDEENSQNHSEGEGQHFLFGDNHVAFHPNPFQGRNADNAFAADTAVRTADSNTPENAAKPQLTITTSSGGPRAENRDRDSMVMPVTGNGDTSTTFSASTVNSLGGIAP